MARKRYEDFYSYPIPSVQRNTLLITQFYVAMFGRSPDIAGLQYWLGQMDGQQSNKLAVLTEMLKSPECGQTYSTAHGPMVGPFATPDTINIGLWEMQKNVTGYAFGVPNYDIINHPNGLNYGVLSYIESHLAPTQKTDNATNENRVTCSLMANEIGKKIDAYFLQFVTADEATIANILSTAN